MCSAAWPAQSLPTPKSTQGNRKVPKMDTWTASIGWQRQGRRPWRWSWPRESRHRQAPKTPLDAATRPRLATLRPPCKSTARALAGARFPGRLTGDGCRSKGGPSAAHPSVPGKTERVAGQGEDCGCRRDVQQERPARSVSGLPAPAKPSARRTLHHRQSLHRRHVRVSARQKSDRAGRLPRRRTGRDDESHGDGWYRPLRPNAGEYRRRRRLPRGHEAGRGGGLRLAVADGRRPADGPRCSRRAPAKKRCLADVRERSPSSSIRWSWPETVPMAMSWRSRSRN